ncbi:hypothetical protein OKW26_001022 [Paraburkholderia sp. 32]
MNENDGRVVLHIGRPLFGLQKCPRTPERFNGIFQVLTEIVPFDGERRAIYRTDY